MRDMLGRKSFRISTIIILVVIVLGFNVPNIISSFAGDDFDDKILVSDPQDVFEGKLGALNDADLDYKFEIAPQNFEEIKVALENGDISSAIMVEKNDNQVNFTYVVDNIATTDTTTPQILTDMLGSLYTNIKIQNLGLTEKELASVTPTFNTEFKQTDDQNIGGNIMVTMLMSVVLFFAIYFCAYQVSTSITIEKTSKIMETLVTSTSPRTIILGKTIGIGTVGLMQILLFAVTAVVSAKLFLAPELLEALFDLSSFTPLLVVITLAYFILGYFAYALLYALTGSTVSKPEDVQSANTPVAIVTMVGFYLAYFTLTDPTSGLNVFAALLPISSPFCMPLRVMMGLASGWEVVASIAILLVFCFVIAKIAIKIYSSAILNYGTRMTLRDIIKSYREK
jgi:ABC-2 type transport system permease protein